LADARLENNRLATRRKRTIACCRRKGDLTKRSGVEGICADIPRRGDHRKTLSRLSPLDTVLIIHA